MSKKPSLKSLVNNKRSILEDGQFVQYTEKAFFGDKGFSFVFQEKRDGKMIIKIYGKQIDTGKYQVEYEDIKGAKETYTFTKSELSAFIKKFKELKFLAEYIALRGDSLKRVSRKIRRSRKTSKKSKRSKKSKK